MRGPNHKSPVLVTSMFQIEKSELERLARAQKATGMTASAIVRVALGTELDRLEAQGEVLEAEGPKGG